MLELVSETGYAVLEGLEAGLEAFDIEESLGELGFLLGDSLLGFGDHFLVNLTLVVALEVEFKFVIGEGKGGGSVSQSLHGIGEMSGGLGEFVEEVSLVLKGFGVFVSEEHSCCLVW